MADWKASLWLDWYWGPRALQRSWVWKREMAYAAGPCRAEWRRPRPPEEVDKEACSQASGDKGPVHTDSRQWRISLSKLAEAWVMEAGGVTRVEKLNLHQEAQSRRSNKPV